MFGNVASNSIDPGTAAFVSSLTATVAAGIYVLGSGASLAVTNRGLVFSAAAGGVLSTLVGVTVGSTIGGTYSVTATVLGVVVLDDPLTFTRAAGVGLAVLAIVVVTQ